MEKTLLIQKILSGTATDAEKVEFDLWRAENPANEEEYEDLKLLYESTMNTAEEMEGRDASHDEGLAVIRSKIARLKKRRRIVPFLIVGTVLTVIIVAATFFLNVSQHPGYWFAPGGTGLVLPDNLSFEDESLEEITRLLEKDYGLVIKVASANLLSCRFTGTFYKDTSAEDLVRTLAQAEGCQYKMIDRQTYELRGDGCPL